MVIIWQLCQQIQMTSLLCAALPWRLCVPQHCLQIRHHGNHWTCGMISRRFDAIHSCCLALPRNILVWDTHEHACREVTQKRTAHTQEVHPYSAFPIERLEAAVTAVPLDSFPVVDRELAQFGAPHRFWSACRHTHASACMSRCCSCSPSLS